MGRADEIAQGLRYPSGVLIGGLHVEDYIAGITDFENGTPPPNGITSTPYDLGRTRAREKAEAEAEFTARLEAEHQRGLAIMRDMLKHRPDLLAEYEAKIAAIRSTTRKAPND